MSTILEDNVEDMQSSTLIRKEEDSGLHKKSYSLPLWWWIVLILLVIIAIFSFIPGVINYFTEEIEVHSPGISDFFPEALFGDGTFWQINRISLARVVISLLLILVFFISLARFRSIPTRFQAVIEYLLEFVREQIAVNSLGRARADRYCKCLAFLFFSIVVFNLTGVVPGIDIALSSVIAVPLVFAVYTWFLYVGAGIKQRGARTFFIEQIFPPGLSLGFRICLSPIELFSNFIVRPVTLTIRLMANMMAGHILLAVTFFGTQVLLLSVSYLKPLAVLTFASSILVTCFEIFVAILQAYVFTTLAAVYVKMSIESH